jgi:hypothetical protein
MRFTLRYRTPLQILVVTGLLFSSSARAYELERASENMAQDLMTCMTYYNWWALADKKNGDDPATMQYNAKWALTLAQQYLPSMNKLDAMSELSAKLINNVVKEGGSARLVLTYGDLCKSALEHPTDRMQFWLDKK